MKRNAVERAETVKVERGYNIDSTDIIDIYKANMESVSAMIWCAFRYGYLRGTNATKAKIKKRKEKVA